MALGGGASRFPSGRRARVRRAHHGGSVGDFDGAAAPVAAAAVPSTHKVLIKIDGVDYYILLSNV